jgi:phage/plasmid-like protein (TIGR03299 family)
LPAEVDTMAYARGVPWHGLGKNLGENLFDAATAIREAGLGWKVKKVPNFYEGLVGGAFWYKPAGSFSIVREDNDKPLGTVGPRYTPIQNDECFSFFDGIVEEGAAIYETVGSLQEGRKVWLLARLPEEDYILHDNETPDISRRYVAAVNSHDGSTGYMAYFTSVRIVCMNTLRMSFGACVDKVSVRHTTNALARMDEAKRVMFTAKFNLDAVKEASQELARTGIQSQSLVEAYVNECFPKPKEGSWKPDKLREEAKKNWEEESDKFGPDWLSAFNAVSGVIDHSEVIAGKGDRRMDSSWFGKGMDQKKDAFRLAEKYAYA